MANPYYDLQQPMGFLGIGIVNVPESDPYIHVVFRDAERIEGTDTMSVDLDIRTGNMRPGITNKMVKFLLIHAPESLPDNAETFGRSVCTCGRHDCEGTE